ncbi:hypothetical protein JHS3_22010 [Jeongeupia sp. HS-3]|nr:hypothetical protein JHS3_22010 [Jeongeupia sp. HS-3]
MLSTVENELAETLSTVLTPIFLSFAEFWIIAVGRILFAAPSSKILVAPAALKPAVPARSCGVEIEMDGKDD